VRLRAVENINLWLISDFGDVLKMDAIFGMKEFHEAMK